MIACAVDEKFLNRYIDGYILLRVIATVLYDILIFLQFHRIGQANFLFIYDKMNEQSNMCEQ